MLVRSRVSKRPKVGYGRCHHIHEILRHNQTRPIGRGGIASRALHILSALYALFLHMLAQPGSRLNIVVKELTTHILKELTASRISVLPIGARLIPYGHASGTLPASRHGGSRAGSNGVMSVSLNFSLFAFKANDIGKLVLHAAFLCLGQIDIIEEDLDTLSLTFSEVRSPFLRSRIVDELNFSACLVLALNGSLKLDFYTGA